jgi:hypothetical protein
MRRISASSRSAAGLILLAAAIAGMQLAAAEPAAAIPGLERKEGASRLRGSEPRKDAVAVCDRDQHVIGGGAIVNDGGRNLVRLTGTFPSGQVVSPDPPVVNSAWAATAEAASGQGGRFPWSLRAYALCADKAFLDARQYQWVHRIVQVPSSGGPFAETSARCPDDPNKPGRDTVAYGAGGFVHAVGDASAKGRIGLQMVRTSGPLDIARITAREENVNFGESWYLRSYAICAEPANAIHAEGEVSQGASARSTCDGNSRVHGAGGGGGLTDGGPVWLRRIYPTGDLKTVTVDLTGPLVPSIGGMVAHHTCAA